MVSKRWHIAVILVLACSCLAGPLSAQADENPDVSASFTPEYYNQVLISFDNGVNVQAFAKKHGLTIDSSFKGGANTYLFNTTTVAKAAALTEQLQGAMGIQSAFQNHSTGYELFSFTPDDPFFNNPAPPNNFGGQWHLGNNLSLPNVNPVGAWANNVTGAGVMIGIVDTGVEPGHEDLVANFSLANTWDYFTNSPNQSFGSNDNHGTAVAGVAGARGGNGIGVTGVAPHAGISSQKTFNNGGAGSAAIFASATTFNSTGANPSIHIKNHSYGYTGAYVNDVMQVNAIDTSTAAGTIHVVAAGNNRGTNGLASGADSNKKMLQNSRNVIAVAALGSNGTYSNYSSFGANVFVTAPSNRTDGLGLGITTVDRTGSAGYNSSSPNDYSNRNYTSTFGGTSSASPLVAGIMALGKEANPNMDTRLAKHVLARTSVIVHANDNSATSDGGWRTNNAGLTFNQNYGFGMVDASAFVGMVSQYEVTPLVETLSGTINVNSTITDNNTTGISRIVDNTVGGELEEVLLTLSVSHLTRGQLEAFVTSPLGYTSRMMYRATDSGDHVNWTFLSNAFWGEEAAGQWTVMVRDTAQGTVGTWNSFSMTWRTGTIVATSVPEPGTGTILAIIALVITARRRR